MEWGRQTSEITSKVIIKLSSNSDWLTFSKQRLSDSLLIFLMFFGSFGIDFLPKYFRDFLSFLFRLRRKFSSCQLRTARHKNCFFSNSTPAFPSGEFVSHEFLLFALISISNESDSKVRAKD